jgi:hypothetical protein
VYIATTGSTIVISQHNPIFEDIRDALTARIMASGVMPMTGPLKLANGAEATPALTFNSATTTGLFKSASGIGLSVGGTKVIEFGTGGIISNLTVTGTLTITGVLTQSSTSHEALPKGTTAQRPSSQTSGRFRYNTDLGFPEFDDGASWIPIRPFSGAFAQYGDIINGTILESHGSNAVTYSLKTLAGNNPSATDPVFVAFRNATSGTGNYVFRQITSALSLTVSSGSTLGTINATPFRVWLVLFDDAGTIRLGAINCLNGLNIFPLGQIPLASSTAEGGAGAADSAHVFFTGTAVTSKPYAILGYCSYESGLTTAGSWDSSPTSIQLFGYGVKLPGDVVQKRVFTGTSQQTSTGSIADVSFSSTPTITPTSAVNLVQAHAFGSLGNPSNGNSAAFASLFRSTNSTLIGTQGVICASNSGGVNAGVVMFAMDKPASSSSITYGVTIKRTGGSDTITWLPITNSLPANTGNIILEEIMV